MPGNYIINALFTTDIISIYSVVFTFALLHCDMHIFLSSPSCGINSRIAGVRYTWWVTNLRKGKQ